LGAKECTEPAQRCRGLPEIDATAAGTDSRIWSHEEIVQ
jgi:hypothetical protein